MTNPLLRSILAVLDGLSTRGDGDTRDESFTLVALQAVGDALRARVPLPGELRRWLRSCRDDELVVALGALVREETSWTLPEHPGEDPALPFIVRRRDETESARVALDWRSVASPAGRELTAAREALDRSLASFDAALTARFSADSVERMLGERAALDDRGWRKNLHHEAQPVADATIEPATEPAPEFIDAWLREGKMFRYVQRSAERDPEFTARLRALVDEAQHDAREDRSLPVSFVAQRWRQMQGAQMDRPTVRVQALPRHALAAATELPRAQRQTVSLGLLAPLEASATVECDGVDATLKVFARTGALTRVTWGERECVSPRDGAPWTATIPLRASPITVDVTGADGTHVEFDVDLQPTDAATSP